MLSRIGVAVLSGFSLLALALYLRQGSLLDRQRQEQQHLVQVERDSLEGVVVQRTAQLTELAHHLQTAREEKVDQVLLDEFGALATCNRRASTRAAAWPATCTTNWAHFSPRPSSTRRASSRASLARRPRRWSGSAT